MQNALSPDLMTPAERLDEVAGLLAAGVLRLRARERAGNASGEREVLLDLSGAASSHGTGNRQDGERA